MADPKRWAMTEEDMESLLRGCAILGTGGGGSSEFGRAIMSNDLRRGRTYELVDVAGIPDDALVVSGGIMGSVRTLERYSPQEIVERWEEQFEGSRRCGFRNQRACRTVHAYGKDQCEEHREADQQEVSDDGLRARHEGTSPMRNQRSVLGNE